ncbi:MAG: hypothetical protein BGO67_07850 [Alphaproteobacteria bacterium 41-28]|nr:MAG: hypothetical protein BGO67_07850 [Alphaproteobacteria bacterium 41-28]
MQLKGNEAFQEKYLSCKNLTKWRPKMEKYNANIKNGLKTSRKRGLKLTSLLLVSSCLFLSQPLYAMEEGDDKPLMSPVRPSRPVSDVNLTVNAKAPINMRKFIGGGIEVVSYGQLIFCIGSLGLREFDCQQQADNLEKYKFVPQVIAAAGKIGLGAWDVYQTRDTKQIGGVFRGTAELLSFFIDLQSSSYFSKMADEEQDKIKKESELSYHTKYYYNEMKEHLNEQLEEIDKDIGDAKELLEIENETAQKKGHERLRAAEKKKIKIENKLDSIDKESKKLKEEVHDASQKISLTKQKINNHEKGAHLIQVLGILAEEYIQKDEDAFKGNYGKVAGDSVSLIGSTMTAAFKADPLRTIKYGEPILKFLRPIYDKIVNIMEANKKVSEVENHEEKKEKEKA